MKCVRLFAGTVIAALLSFSCTAPPSDKGEAEMLAALTAFLRAFENGDLEAMEASFTEGATSFGRSVMSNEIAGPIDTTDYKRVRGMPRQMRELVGSWQSRPDGPPYMALEPKDLEVQMFTDAAVVTLHLENERSLSRRTFVLAKNGDSWKIVHLHPSNVLGSE